MALATNSAWSVASFSSRVRTWVEIPNASTTPITTKARRVVSANFVPSRGFSEKAIEWRYRTSPAGDGEPGSGLSGALRPVLTGRPHEVRIVWLGDGIPTGHGRGRPSRRRRVRPGRHRGVMEPAGDRGSIRVRDRRVGWFERAGDRSGRAGRAAGGRAAGGVRGPRGRGLRVPGHPGRDGRGHPGPPSGADTRGSPFPSRRPGGSRSDAVLGRGTQVHQSL